jgi:ribonucleoside-diphosphate reductase alpha chain
MRVLHVACRSALISLSDVNDDTMRTAKAGPWWEDAAQRAMANNSAVYTGGACNIVKNI